ncbi:MAG: response regulator [Candidatus Latescibacteria bacterium]|nr:response regulator [Candidatus Latescibacterota bacterium]
MQKSIIVIDDDEAVLLSVNKILSKAGFHVETFEDGVSGLEGVTELKPDLVVVDLRMPGLSGMEVINRVSEMDPYIIIVVITGYATIDTAVEAIKLGAYDFLPKPFSPDELRVIVNRGLEHRQLLQESHRLEIERELLKRQFVTLVSHQLKTPLVAIHQYLDTLKQLGDTPDTASKRQDWLERCLQRTDEVLAIIKDWLTLSKVESGSLTGEILRVDLKPIILNTMEANADMAAEQGITLEAELPADEYPVKGDRNCLAVLFDNLMVNAIKYNKPEGRVSVSVKAQDHQIVVAVADTGIGIPEKYRQALFDEFFRVKGQSSGQTTGTGLGLAICKRITTEMGGTIEVESELDVGSTFRVSLPAYHEKADQEEENRSTK